jgi:hypothetical protein
VNSLLRTKMCDPEKYLKSKIYFPNYINTFKYC